MVTDIAEHTQIGWRFWLLWVFASSVGLAVGLALGFLIVFLSVAIATLLSFSSGMNDVEEAVIVAFSGAEGGAVFGASIGLAQRLVLRRRVSQIGGWVLASTVGAAVGGAVSVVAFFLAPLPEASLAAGGAVLIGASVGIAQWLRLRRYVYRSGWWVLASTMGFAVIAAAIVFGTEEIFVFSVIGILTVLAIVWYGAITGGVLVWLLRQPVTKEPSLPQDAA